MGSSSTSSSGSRGHHMTVAVADTTTPPSRHRRHRRRRSSYHGTRIPNNTTRIRIHTSMPPHPHRHRHLLNRFFTTPSQPSPQVLLPPIPPQANLTPHGDQKPKQPNDGGNDGIRSDGGDGSAREPEPEPPVDDAESDGDASDPDVGVGPDGAVGRDLLRLLLLLLLALEARVVDETEGWLEG